MKRTTYVVKCLKAKHCFFLPYIDALHRHTLPDGHKQMRLYMFLEKHKNTIHTDTFTAPPFTNEILVKHTCREGEEERETAPLASCCLGTAAGDAHL